MLGRAILLMVVLGMNYEDSSKYSIADFYIFINLMFTIFSLHKVNLDFITFGVIDFKRKLYYQKILNDLLDIERSGKNTDFSHFIPNIDILNPSNLQTWVDLRR